MSGLSQEQIMAHLKKSGIVRNRTQRLSTTQQHAGSSLVASNNYGQEKTLVPNEHPAGVVDTQSVVLNPFNRMMHRGRSVIEPNRRITYRILRVVAEKAFLINTIISHMCLRIRPYLNVSTNKNIRGFEMQMRDRDNAPTDEDKTNMRKLERFLLNTGWGNANEREDKLVHFVMKMVRDLFTLDQVSTELQRTYSGKLWAFFAIDPATIFRCTEEGYDGDDRIRFIQEVDTIPMALYTADDLLFQYRNPRTDINYYGYGYSETEQAIDLITAAINSFVFNSSFFTENRLPRGMLLLNGDAGMEDVEMIEEYIISIMSGPATQWRIPIIPAGLANTGDGANNNRAFEWLDLQKSNREMEFPVWMDFIWSGVAALFGIDLEELGIKTQKQTTLVGENNEPRITESKSRSVGGALAFIQDHLNAILEKVDERYKMVFVGMERDDIKLKNDTTTSELATFKSIDDIRKERDMKPYNEEWSKMPLNPVAVQILNASKMADMQQQDGNGNDDSDQEDDQTGYRNSLLNGPDMNPKTKDRIQKAIEIII